MTIDPHYQIDPNDSAQFEAQVFLRAQPRHRTPLEMVRACGNHLSTVGRLREDEAFMHAAYAFDQLNAQGGVACTH